MSQSKLHPEYLRQKALQDAYLARKNKKTDFYNGIYDRDRKSTRLNSSHTDSSRMPSSA